MGEESFIEIKREHGRCYPKPILEFINNLLARAREIYSFTYPYIIGRFGKPHSHPFSDIDIWLFGEELGKEREKEIVRSLDEIIIEETRGTLLDIHLYPLSYKWIYSPKEWRCVTSRDLLDGYDELAKGDRLIRFADGDPIPGYPSPFDERAREIIFREVGLSPDGTAEWLKAQGMDPKYGFEKFVIQTRNMASGILGRNLRAIMSEAKKRGFNVREEDVLKGIKIYNNWQKFPQSKRVEIVSKNIRRIWIASLQSLSKKLRGEEKFQMLTGKDFAIAYLSMKDMLIAKAIQKTVEAAHMVCWREPILAPENYEAVLKEKTLWLFGAEAQFEMYRWLLEKSFLVKTGRDIWVESDYTDIYYFFTQMLLLMKEEARKNGYKLGHVESSRLRQHFKRRDVGEGVFGLEGLLNKLISYDAEEFGTLPPERKLIISFYLEEFLISLNDWLKYSHAPKNPKLLKNIQSVLESLLGIYEPIKNDDPFITGKIYSVLGNILILQHSALKDSKENAVEMYKIALGKRAKLGWKFSESVVRGEILCEIGETLFDLGKYKQALKYLRRGLKYDPLNDELWANLGRVLEKIGEMEGKRECDVISSTIIRAIDLNEESFHRELPREAADGKYIGLFFKLFEKYGKVCLAEDKNQILQEIEYVKSIKRNVEMMNEDFSNPFFLFNLYKIKLANKIIEECEHWLERINTDFYFFVKGGDVDNFVKSYWKWSKEFILKVAWERDSLHESISKLETSLYISLDRLLKENPQKVAKFVPTLREIGLYGLVNNYYEQIGKSKIDIIEKNKSLTNLNFYELESRIKKAKALLEEIHGA